MKKRAHKLFERREALSLGRFAEQVGSWLNFAAAEVPCKTAPFASFSGRTEKEGPARPERIPISSSLVQTIKKTSILQKFYEIVFVHLDVTISLFRHAVDSIRAYMDFEFIDSKFK